MKDMNIWIDCLKLANKCTEALLHSPLLETPLNKRDSTTIRGAIANMLYYNTVAIQVTDKEDNDNE